MKTSDPFTVGFPAELPVEQSGEAWFADAGGVRQRLTNLAKVFWPEEGITKGDLLAYYFNVAPTMLPYLADRPVTMKRMPDGVAGGHFYQKDAPDYTPPWITRCAIEPEDGKVDEMVLVQSVAELLFVVNLGCIELHPLHSRCERYDQPDYLVVDLDPFPPAGFEDALAVAGYVHTLLERLDLRSYPKTSGATGIQIYVPVDEKHSYEETRGMAERMARMIRKADPQRVTVDWPVSQRTGKVFIDFNMNRRAASLAAAYSARPEPGATVSTPLTWAEVDEGTVRPADFTIRNILDRLAGEGDLFRGVAEPQDLDAALDDLGVGRSRRDISEGRVRRRIQGG
ncbi:MAG TPA: non-homologous end-joining DNA ligase [Actinomycetota bacterium]|nr:non-homologous end-joining DNA ligase [Actinomycetota bacterium]